MAFRAGEGGREMWPDCRKKGVAAIYSSAMQGIDLSDYARGEPKDAWHQLATPHHYSMDKFVHEMKRGDVIYVKQGPQIVGKGIVQRKYQFVANSTIRHSPKRPWQHQLKVRWDDAFSPVTYQLGDQQRYTIRELTDEDTRRFETSRQCHETYVLVWNPKRFSFEEFPQSVTKLQSGKNVEFTWSTGNTKRIRRGDRVLFFVCAGAASGLIGSGIAVSNCEVGRSGETWRKRKTAPYIDVRWNVLLPREQALPRDALMKASHSVPWNQMQASGIHVPHDEMLRIEGLWQDHLYDLQVQSAKSPFLPEELTDGGRFFEGASTKIAINAYERNPKARAACLAHHGTTCAVCDLDLKTVYGPLGDGYIHVHHLRDLASIGKRYKVDPIADLRPVCPNCHAMLHREQPAMMIEELRKLVLRNRKTSQSCRNGR